MVDMSTFTILPLAAADAEHLRQLPDPIVHVADESPGYPCRACLRDAEVGDELILVSHDPFALDSPYRSASPIFVHRHPCEADTATGEIPAQLERRLLSVRAFDADEMMIDARVDAGTALASILGEMFADASTDVVHVHNATRGCWAARVERA
jgi:Protein of unknown function (DUF1203)